MKEMESLINKPSTKKGKETLNNILNASIQLFYEKGYHSTSIKEITSLAGVASGTFYVYFDGKYNLYKYLLLRCSRSIKRTLTEAIKDCKTRREAERVGLKSWLLFVLKNQYLYHIIWESMYIDQELFNHYYISFCRAYMKGLRGPQEAGEISNINLEVLAYTLMGASNFLGLRWGIFDENVPEEEVEHVVDEFMKILDNGIFNKETQKTIIEEPANEIPADAPRPRLRFNLCTDDDEF